MQPILFYNRKTGQIVSESVMGDKALRFAYETLLGRTLWPLLFGSRIISALMGAYYDSRLSRKAIRSLASLPGCEAQEAEKPVDAYPTFNAFFTRHLKAGARPIGEGFVSPADGRLMLYRNIEADQPLLIKGAKRPLAQLLTAKKSEKTPLSGKYDVVVVRLAPVDYHRFHYPCACETKEAPRVIRGRYHSVNPIAFAKCPDVYIENARQVVACQASFGPFWSIDVGAFGVASIIQTASIGSHKKGDERGYFKFGGSTVVLVVPAGKLTFDEDLLTHSEKGIETLVRMGEQIAVIKEEVS